MEDQLLGFNWRAPEFREQRVNEAVDREPTQFCAESVSLVVQDGELGPLAAGGSEFPLSPIAARCS